MKAATATDAIHTLNTGISIHAAREGGDEYMGSDFAGSMISIHAAREGGDPACIAPLLYQGRFQSTPPVKAATKPIDTLMGLLCDFNPRRP